MKILVLTLTLLSASVVWAGGVSGSGGTGLVTPASFEDGCVDGNVGSVTLRTDDGAAYEEPRVCWNGSYMTAEERAAWVEPPAVYHCSGEGHYEDWYVRGEYVKVRCVEHRWVRVSQ